MFQKIQKVSFLLNETAGYEDNGAISSTHGWVNGLLLPSVMEVPRDTLHKATDGNAVMLMVAQINL